MENFYDNPPKIKERVRSLCFRHTHISGVVMKLECSPLPLPLPSLAPLAADCKSFRHRTNHVKEGSNKIGLTEGGRAAKLVFASTSPSSRSGSQRGKYRGLNLGFIGRCRAVFFRDCAIKHEMFATSLFINSFLSFFGRPTGRALLLFLTRCCGRARGRPCLPIAHEKKRGQHSIHSDLFRRID